MPLQKRVVLQQSCAGKSYSTCDRISFQSYENRPVPPRFFKNIIPGKLYSGSSFNDSEAKVKYIKNLGIKTVVYINIPKDNVENDSRCGSVGQNERELAGKYGLSFIEMFIDDPRWSDKYINRSKQELNDQEHQIAGIMEDPNIQKPVYLHCFGGVNRTPLVLGYYENYLAQKGERHHGFKEYLQQFEYD